MAMPRKAAAAVSLTFPGRWLAPVAAAAALGLAATPAAADQVRHREWWLSAVHATTAWQTSRGAGVTVAVLDSGVDTAQADLTGSVATGPDYTRLGERPGSPYWGGHGTGMAALIAGHGHGPGGADGTTGIAPRARILSIRVVPDRGDPALDGPGTAARLPGSIAAGIRYAAAHGATVIDLPLDPGTAGFAGHGRTSSSAAGGSAAEREAVSYALARGAVLVAPAGDDRDHGGALNYPAAYPGVMAVGAVDRSFDLAHFSSRRSYVTLTGPGVDVVTARPGGGYTSVSSTAASSAVTAGVAALVRSEHPRLQAAQVAQAITQGTLFRHARRAGSGYGALDAAGALRAAAAISAASGAAPANPAASASSGAARSAQPTPAGFTGNVLRYLIGAAAVLVVIVAAFLIGLALMRRRRARRPRQYTPGPESPLSGGLSGPPPTAAEQDSPLRPPPGPDRRPLLAPVTGLRGLGNAKPQTRSSSRPPWEDAPKPPNPARGWPMAANPSPGPGTGWPWMARDSADARDGAGALDAPGNGDGPNGQLSWDGSGAGTPGGRHAGLEHTSTSAEPGSEDKQAFSAVPPPGSSRSGPAAADDALYEEEGPDFDDEDDRHL
jgi:serine protease